MPNDDLSRALVVQPTPALVVRPGVEVDVLARALIAAAHYPVPIAFAEMDRWWTTAAPAHRVRLVLRLARALTALDALTARRIEDPAWRLAVGLPLAMAQFALARRARRGYRARNTLKAWASDWKIWRRWCKRLHYPTFNPSADQLKAFFKEHAPCWKVATVRRFGATLTAMHAAAGLGDPLATNPGKDVWRTATTPPNTQTDDGQPALDADGNLLDRRDAETDQAAGLTREALEAAIARCDPKTPIGARDAALLAVGYDVGGRESEIVALNAGDLVVVGQHATLRVHRRKTNTFGAQYIRPDTLERVRRWMAIAGIATAAEKKLTEEEKLSPIFVALRGFAGKSADALRKRNKNLKRLKPYEVAKLIRRRLAAAGLTEVELYSGHSLRVGAAQDLSDAGVSTHEIMNFGGWSTPVMPARYTAGRKPERSGMAKLARKQQLRSSASRTQTSGPGTE